MYDRVQRTRPVSTRRIGIADGTLDAAGKITAISMTGPVGNPAEIIALTGSEMGPALFGAMGLLLAGLLAGALALGRRRRGILGMPFERHTWARALRNTDSPGVGGNRRH